MRFESRHKPPADSPIAAAQRATASFGERVRAPEFDHALVRAAMEDGAMVSVTVRYWKKRHALSHLDLGFPAPVRGMKDSSIGLLPPTLLDELQAAATKIRRAAHLGFRVEGYDGRFVTARQWPEFRRRFADGRRELERVLGRVYTDRDKHVEWLRHHVETCIAPAAWRGHRETWRSGQHAALEVAPADFVDEMATRVIARVPTAEVMRADAEVKYVLTVLHVPDVVSAVLVAQGELRSAIESSLTEQRDSLPARFADGVIRAAAAEIAAALDSVRRADAKSRGSVTRAVSRTRAAVKAARATNVTCDARLERALDALSTALCTAEARAAAGNQGMAVTLIADLLAHAHEDILKLTFLADEAN